MAVSTKGLFKRRGSKKWHGIIQVNNKRWQIAFHENKEIAAEMRAKKKEKYNKIFDAKHTEISTL